MIFGGVLPGMIGSGSLDPYSKIAFTNAMNALGGVNAENGKGDTFICPEFRAGVGQMIINNIAATHDEMSINGSHQGSNQVEYQHIISDVAAADIPATTTIDGKVVDVRVGPGSQIYVAENKYVTELAAQGPIGTDQIDAAGRIAAAVSAGQNTERTAEQNDVDHQQDSLLKSVGLLVDTAAGVLAVTGPEGTVISVPVDSLVKFFVDALLPHQGTAAETEAKNIQSDGIWQIIARQTAAQQAFQGCISVINKSHGDSLGGIITTDYRNADGTLKPWNSIGKVPRELLTAAFKIAQKDSPLGRDGFSLPGETETFVDTGWSGMFPKDAR